MFLLTGTPGVGKSTIADLLEKKGYLITRAKETIQEYIIETGEDNTCDDICIDVDAWAAHFGMRDGIVEGHFSHFIPGAKGVIILRCNPDILTERLRARGYAEEKVRENVEAEVLDVVLIEAYDLYSQDQIYEIDGSYTSAEELVSQIEHVLTDRAFPCCGIVDWTWWV
ncbi:MAG: adenylate kinase family protein [Methanomicrobiales archaeon]|jgi:adenylate kinase|nr:adenylate kinase family protein [Methanomicrobiales archaeon]